MTGFFIQEVRATGFNMPDAIVPFGRGLSLLTGPSDTGKSFVADAISHVFGAQGPLRGVAERGNYDKIFVEIVSFETGVVYSLERAWAGGAILLHESSIEEAKSSSLLPRTLKEVHDSTTGSVSGFLLSLSGLNNKSP